VRLELDLGDSGLQYAPGDALGIYPRNAPKVGKEAGNWSGTVTSE
jgi:sulfite reductase alpha subunit-like flavoprotein